MALPTATGSAAAKASAAKATKATATTRRASSKSAAVAAKIKEARPTASATEGCAASTAALND